MSLSPPPRDGDGAVLPHDHPGIENDDGVIRRISPQFVVNDTKVLGGSRLSTLAFHPSSPAHGGGLSIDLEKEIRQAGVDAIAYVSSPPWIGAVRFEVGALRTLGFQIGYDPIVATASNPVANPYHGEIWGIATKSHQKSLMRIATWFLDIPHCALHAG